MTYSLYKIEQFNRYADNYFMLKNFILIIIIILSLNTFAQKSALSGQLVGGNREPVYNSVIALLTPKDSILYKFTRSDKEGKFEFKNIKPGNFIIMTSHSRFADYVENIDIKNGRNDVGAISLMSKTELLREIDRKSTRLNSSHS